MLSKGLLLLSFLLVLGTNSKAATLIPPKDILDTVPVFRGTSLQFSVRHAMREVLSQSILSQTIAKTFVAVANPQLNSNYSKKLFELIDLFDQKMNLVSQGLPDKTIQAAIDDVRIMWENYKLKVSAIEDISQGDISIVLIQAKALSDACHDVLIRINDYAKKVSPNKALSKGDAIHARRFDDLRAHFKLSNELAILNQSVALFYILEMEASIFPTNNDHLWNALDDFEAKFKEMQQSVWNKKAGYDILKNCSKEWSWIKTASQEPKETDLKELLEHHEKLADYLFELSELYKNRIHETYMDTAPKTYESNQVQITEN